MHHHIRIAEKLTTLLDRQFNIVGFRFGIDPILGLIPGGGDFVSLVLSFYIIWIAMQMRVPSNKIALMVGNILFDFFIGLVPIVGDITDFVYKANVKNMEILKSHHLEVIKPDK